MASLASATQGMYSLSMSRTEVSTVTRSIGEVLLGTFCSAAAIPHLYYCCKRSMSRYRPTICSKADVCQNELIFFSFLTNEYSDSKKLLYIQNSDQDEPTFVDALRGVGVSQIACGSGHTVVLTTDGQVYTWGRGDDGRLGHGDNGWKYVPRIAQSLSGQVIVQVTCGSYHTAAVASNGDLFTWGGGMYGKLGHGNESGHSTPRRVEGLVGLTVSQIACGSRHTAVLTSTGALYTWGDKENGVAGHGDTEGHQYTPKLLERMAGKRVIQLSACGFHTGCLTDSHEVYTVSR